MDRWENFALVTFLACDAIIENSENFKLFSKYYFINFKYETKDIFKRLFK